ncbi:MAG: cation transporter [Myxococcaceae bacterium]|nr:cation transporter [Myxococcaceae bacterium]
MIEAFVSASLRNRAAVIALALLTLLLGYFAFREVSIEAFPDPTDTQVNIITLMPGQPAEEMERQVSIPIERVINGTPGLSRVRSLNLFGLSYVTLTFRDGIDVLFARAQTLERLRLVDLPEGVTPQLGSLSTPIGEIYRYTLTAPKANPLALRTTQDWVVRPRLLRVEGVADVVSYGGLLREIEVRPDMVSLAAKGLGIADLKAALQGSSVNASGGIVEQGTEQLIIRSTGLFDGLDDIEHTSVATRGGTPIYVSDVASVTEGWQPRQGVVGQGKDPDVVEGIVLMRRGENPTLVLSTLRDKIAELNKTVLKDGVQISTFYDRTELVDSTLGTVGRNLIEGAILVMLVLFAFLLDLRAAMAVTLVIPLSLATAFIYLHVRGMSANLISLGAVDFGIIVDGAVVIIEAIVHRMSHDHHDKPGGVVERVDRAVREVARPTVFSLLIIIAAYLPIFLLQRVEGRIFAPLAHTVVAALLGRLVFSMTLVPVLATFAYRNPRKHRESWLLRAFDWGYMPALKVALRWPLLVIGIAIASLAASVHLIREQGSEFLPELNEGALYVTFTLPSNVSLSEGRRLAPTLLRMLDQFPEVQSTMSQLGRPEDGTDPKLSNNLELFIKLKPATEWPKSTPDLGTLIEKLNRVYAQIPGLEVNFSQPIRDNVNESIAGQSGQIALKLYADDLELLQQTAEAAKRVLANVPGVADLGIVKSGVVPQLQVHPHRQRLGRFGLTLQDFQSYLATALGGQVVEQLWEGDRSFDVVLRLPVASRDTVEEISALRVPTHGGALVPLPALADVGVDYGRAAINRENGQRYVGVRMNVRGRDLGSFVHDAQLAIRQQLPKTQGLTMEWGGEFESKERAMNRLLVVLPLALIVTLVLLFNAFGSLPLALLVLFNVPFALIGGGVGLWAMHMPLSIAAAVGFIALIGQAALNGVLVLSAIEARRKAGASLDEAVVEGSRERLRAVLMTAALAAFGLVPAAMSKSMGAETQRPIAVVIVGGTVSAALLTLFVLPVVYRAAFSLWARWRNQHPTHDYDPIED